MKNEFEIRGPITVIFIQRKDGVNLETLIDTEDLERVTRDFYALYAYFDKTVNGYYAVGLTKDRVRVKFHRYILNAPKGKIVDHKNRNTLINTKENLRLATATQSA